MDIARNGGYKEDVLGTGGQTWQEVSNRGGRGFQNNQGKIIDAKSKTINFQFCLRPVWFLPQQMEKYRLYLLKLKIVMNLSLLT